MTDKIKKGKYGEDLAVDFLSIKGYYILTRNYRYKKSEIDIIALYDNMLIFVEVKTRTSQHFGYPETFVNPRQKEKIFQGALQFMEEKNWKGNVRYDIITVELSVSPVKIQHFEDAFY